MTNRRLPHTPATSHRTGGDDRPAGTCYGLAERMAPDPTPFDVLTDLSAGPAFEAARREARDLCGVRADGKFRAPEDRCPLAAVCLMRDNAEEPWAQAVLGANRPRYVSVKRQAASNANRDQRLAELRKLVDQGATLEQALDHLGLNTRHQLYKWCHRHGHLDLWHALTPHLKANQHRRKSVAA